MLTDTVRYATADVMAGTSSLTPMELEQALTSPAAALGLLGGRTGDEISEGRFKDLVRLEGARRGFRAFYVSLLDPRSLPALIHCSTGKDRTGWAVAALLSLLGVPRQHVMADYLRSGELLEPMTQPARAAFVSQGGDAALFESLAGVRPENLEAAFDEVECLYGSIDNYFDRGLGVDAAFRAALQSSLVVGTSNSEQGDWE